MPATIVTLTMNPALDAATATQAIVPASKLRCEEPRYDPGGGGINVARAVRLLGGDAFAVYPAGGAAGERIQGLLEREGLPQAVLPIAGMTRESLAVVDRRSGLQYRFLLPGPPLSEAEQGQLLALLAAHAGAAAFIVATGSLPPGVPCDFYARVARLARQHRVCFVLDSSGEALTEAGGGIYLIKASLHELQQLHGAPIDGLEAQIVAARAVVASGRCEILVVSLGAEGALLATHAGVRQFPAAPVTAVSNVGAGDCMLAGILLALARGWALDKAVRFGTAAGAAALLRPGTELCRRADAEQLYRELCAQQMVGPAGLEPATAPL